MLPKREMLQAFVMTIALLGILSLQTYWFLASLQLKEEQFDRAVKTALLHATNDIKQNAVEELFTPEAVRPFVTPETKSSIFKKDTLPDGSVFETITTKTVVDSLEKQGISYLPGEFFSNIFGKMNSILSKKSSLHLYKADSILSRSLKLYGLPQHYEAMVFTPGLNKVDTLRGTFEKPLKNEATYEALIFEGSVFSPPQFLIVHFPGKTRLLLTQTLPFVVTFLILCSVIVYIYLSTLRRLLWQKQLSQMKTDFINNMTHEFKTPIASISLAADSIVNERIINQPDLVRKYSQIIKDENKRMNRHVESVLQSAVLDSGRLELKRELLPLTEIILFAEERTQFSHSDKNVSFINNFNGLEPYVHVDYTHFSNVFANLFENAIKYNVNEPIIEVSLDKMPNQNIVQIIVKDNGIGISKEKISTIFDKFMRVSEGDIHNVKGFGLGLFYVRSIIELHGGSITASSIMKKGTQMIIKLPYQNKKV